MSSCLCVPDVPSLVSPWVGRKWLWNILQSQIQYPQGRAWFPCSYGSRAWWGHSAPFWMPIRGCVSLCPVSSFPLPGHTPSVSALSSPSGLPCCPLTRLFLGKGLYGLDMWIIVIILFGATLGDVTPGSVLRNCSWRSHSVYHMGCRRLNLSLDLGPHVRHSASPLSHLSGPNPAYFP